MTNYYSLAKYFAGEYYQRYGVNYVIKKGKDFKHLKKVEVVVKDNDWHSLFTKFFDWHDDSKWCRDNNVIASLGLLEASINAVVSFKKPEVFKYKEL